MKLGCLLARRAAWKMPVLLGCWLLPWELRSCANDLTQVALAAEQLYKLQTPPYGKRPLRSWAGLGYQLLHIYPLASSLNPFQTSYGTQWPDSGCIQASLVPLTVPVGAWAEDMPIVCRYLVSVMETFLLYQHFRPTLELPGEAPPIVPTSGSTSCYSPASHSRRLVPRGPVLGEGRWGMGPGGEVPAPSDQPLSLYV